MLPELNINEKTAFVLMILITDSSKRGMKVA